MAENFAERSGMRGSKPQETEKAYKGPETASEENMADLVGEHVLGPDFQGHTHLNLTTLASHIGKKSNPKPLTAMEANSEGKLHESPRVPPTGDGKK